MRSVQKLKRTRSLARALSPLLLLSSLAVCSGDKEGEDPPETPETAVLGLLVVDLATGQPVHGECELVDNEGYSLDPPVFLTTDTDGVCELFDVDPAQRYSIWFTAPGYMDHYVMNLSIIPSPDPNTYYYWLMNGISTEARDLYAEQLGMEADPERGHVIGSANYFTSDPTDESHSAAIGCVTISSDPGVSPIYNNESNQPDPALTATDYFRGSFEMLNLEPVEHTITATVGGRSESMTVSSIWPNSITVLMFEFQESEHGTLDMIESCY